MRQVRPPVPSGEELRTGTPCQPAGNQTGIVLPTFKDWYDQSKADQYGYKFDTDKAKSLLQGANFPAGKTFNIITVAGYTDWDASLQVIQDNLKAADLRLTAEQAKYLASWDEGT